MPKLDVEGQGRGVEARDAVVLVVGDEQPAGEIDTRVVRAGRAGPDHSRTPGERLERAAGGEALDAVVAIVNDKDRVVTPRIDGQAWNQVELPGSGPAAPNTTGGPSGKTVGAEREAVHGG